MGSMGMGIGVVARCMGFGDGLGVCGMVMV